mmetsp:Transcript_76442/g.221998  ORF Transcript_76442/g.221998 Transcript_76442/m.221998 type:complete len:616 (+) Transcript_76442:75-1922(+)
MKRFCASPLVAVVALALLGVQVVADGEDTEAPAGDGHRPGASEDSANAPGGELDARQVSSLPIQTQGIDKATHLPSFLRCLRAALGNLSRSALSALGKKYFPHERQGHSYLPYEPENLGGKLTRLAGPIVFGRVDDAFLYGMLDFSVADTLTNVCRVLAEHFADLPHVATLLGLSNGELKDLFWELSKERPKTVHKGRLVQHLFKALEASPIKKAQLQSRRPHLWLDRSKVASAELCPDEVLRDLNRSVADVLSEDTEREEILKHLGTELQQWSMPALWRISKAFFPDLSDHHRKQPVAITKAVLQFVEGLAVEDLRNASRSSGSNLRSKVDALLDTRKKSHWWVFELEGMSLREKNFFLGLLGMKQRCNGHVPKLCGMAAMDERFQEKLVSALGDPGLRKLAASTRTEALRIKIQERSLPELISVLEYLDERRPGRGSSPKSRDVVIGTLLEDGRRRGDAFWHNLSDALGEPHLHLVAAKRNYSAASAPGRERSPTTAASFAVVAPVVARDSHVPELRWQARHLKPILPRLETRSRDRYDETRVDDRRRGDAFWSNTLGERYKYQVAAKRWPPRGAIRRHPSQGKRGRQSKALLSSQLPGMSGRCNRLVCKRGI